MDARYDPRYDEAFQRGYEGETVVPEPAVPPASIEPQVDTSGPEADAEPVRNPWLVGIWVMAGALITGSVVSAGLVMTAFSQPNAFSGPWALVLLLIPPALFVPGAIALVVGMALRALRAEGAAVSRPGSGRSPSR